MPSPLVDERDELIASWIKTDPVDIERRALPLVRRKHEHLAVAAANPNRAFTPRSIQQCRELLPSFRVGELFHGEISNMCTPAFLAA